MRPTANRLTALGLVLALVLLCSACDWTQFMGNPALNGNNTSETTVTAANVSELTQTYTIALPSGTTGGAPVTSNGRLFVSTSDGHLVAASQGTTGCAGSPLVCQPLWTASYAGADTAGTPLVANNVVYETFLSDSSNSTGYALAAYDADGVTNCSGTPVVCQPLWTAPVVTTTGVNVDQGKVFVTNLVTDSLEVYDANGVTNCSGTPTVCHPLWSAPEKSVFWPTIAGGKVYLASFSSAPASVMVYDEAGSTNCSGTPVVCQPLWTVPLPAVGFGGVDVSHGVGYVETETVVNQFPALVAFDATGTGNCTGSPVVCQPLWSAPLPGPTNIYGTPSVANGMVYAGSGGDEVFDAAGVVGCSGTPVVCQPVRGDLGQAHNQVVTDDLLFAGVDVYAATGSNGCTTAVPAICSPLWTAPGFSPGADAYSIVADGTVYIDGTDASVHAYRVPGT